jgi:hypothetical protein
MPRLHAQSLSATFFRLSTLHLPLSILLCTALLSGTSDKLRAQSVTFTEASPSVKFSRVNLCAPGKTTPAPCSQTLTLTYRITASGTLGGTKVVTGGVPNLDFTMAEGSTCTGSITQGESCVVKVTFAPKYIGLRSGAVKIVDASNTVLATTFIYGFGDGPQIGFDLGTPIAIPLSNGFIPSRLATDGIGNIFMSNPYGSFAGVIELPVGGGPQRKLPFSNSMNYASPTVDGAGDVLAIDYTNNHVVELPASGSAQFTLSFDYTAFGQNVSFEGLTTDPRGDVFLTAITPSGSEDTGAVVELPPGGGKQITLPFSGLEEPFPAATDYAGDVFVQSYQYVNVAPTWTVFELPDGSAPQKTLIQTPPFSGEGLTADGAGDVFTSSYQNFGQTGTMLELPAGDSTPIPLATGPYLSTNSQALGPSGDVFFTGYADVASVSPTGSNVFVLQRSQPPALDFGETPVASTTTLPLTIQNTGTAVLTVTPAFDTTSYTVASMSPAKCLAGIPAAQTCTLQIQFAPVIAGPQNGVFTLQTNGLSNAAVHLSGTTGVETPVIGTVSGVYSSSFKLSVPITDGTPDATIYYTTDGSVPTSASKKYTAPIAITSTTRLNAIALFGSLPSAVATAAYTIVSEHTNDFNFSTGFANAQGYYPPPPGKIVFGGSTTLDGSNLQLTGFANNYYPTGLDEAGSAFYTTPVNIQAFTTDFIFQLTNPEADGFTFTIQNSSASINTIVLGDHGAGLGYAGIPKSVAFKFDLHDDSGEGPNSTGLYTDGAQPTVPAISLNGTGLNLHNGETILAHLTYDGSNLAVTLTDLVTLATWSHSFPIDIPTVVGGKTATVGFTAGTGKKTAIQEILAWTFVSGAPVTPAPAPPASPSVPSLPHYPSGFATTGLVANGSATHSGTALQLTDDQTFEAGSAFYANKVNIQSFSTGFSFRQTGLADGMTFTIQNAGVNALGNYGEALGYAPISNSVAVKFDIHNNQGEGFDSTGLYADGALPTIPALDLTDTGIYLQSGYPFIAHIIYDGVNLNLTITNQVWQTTSSQSFPIDIPTTVGGNTAYVGFTGGTGADTAIQQIFNWTFTNP